MNIIGVSIFSIFLFSAFNFCCYKVSQQVDNSIAFLNLTEVELLFVITNILSFIITIMFIRALEEQKKNKIKSRKNMKKKAKILAEY